MASHRRILDDSIADHLCYYDCNVTGPPPPSLAVVEAPPHHHHHVSTLLFVVAAVFSAFLLLSLIYFAVLRRRRRVGGAFLSAGASSGRSPASDAGETATPAFDEAEEPLHHVWYIRTVGLDEATIDKIAVAEYKSGEGLLAGASGDCSVCLGEFCDGELVRLLPKCGHAFHVPCIDTWLRAHVNCPLCRASIVDPTPLAASPPPATTVVSSPDDVEMGSSVPVDIPTTGIHASEHEQNRTPDSEAAVHVVALANPIELSDAVVESFVPRTQIEHRDDMPQPVRRSASMDSPIFGAVVIRLEPQESFNSAAKEDNYGDIREQYVCRSMEKQGNAQTEIQRSLSSSARGFFYKHSRISKNSSLPS